ncbi:F-box protein SKIP14-like [Prosopis cineraria]|uniref:F-box protein SKIP14-like n=1 Tax=Prosopis cineraria TaxID=364024 RepID=UPI00240FD5AC|nr:F-box protein SKIP14-like [Prosopis cineraria]
MALNFSCDLSFPASPEKSTYRSIGPVVDGYLLKKSGCFGNSWSFCSFNKALEDNPCDELVNADLGDFDDPAAVVVDDILDRLPRDPFGMNIIKSTFPEISDWIQDFDWHFPSEYDVFGADETHTKIDCKLFADLYWGWNGAGAGSFPSGGNDDANEMSVSDQVFDRFQIFDWLFDSGLVSDGNVETLLPASHEDSSVSSGEAEVQNSTKIDYDGEAGSPHDAMRLVLNYLGVTDLLSVEQVCTSLRDCVKANPLLWWSIHIDQSLSLKITDGILVKLTNRAQGFLQSLTLVNCIRITDSGLRRVLQSNPRLTKLSVPGCVRLTVEGILIQLRALKSSGKPGIKHIEIGGIPNVTDKDFEELKFLLDVDRYLQQRVQRPRFYQGWYPYALDTLCDDDRAIDIELCPLCQRPRRVYDCPAESCQQKQQASQLCRGCLACIERCIHCGKCIKDLEYEETFCLDLLCLNCWHQLVSFPDEPVGKNSSRHTVISPRTMYKFCKLFEPECANSTMPGASSDIFVDCLNQNVQTQLSGS